MLQSTSPARGKTPKHTQGNCPLGASIHFPREGEDLVAHNCINSGNCFNPLPPRGGRRHNTRKPRSGDSASIHFPREGEELFGPVKHRPGECFNPLPPRGGRLVHNFLSFCCVSLQSTSPARGKTMDCFHHRTVRGASIHFPREGEDTANGAGSRRYLCFNPLPPRGGRPILSDF